MDRNNAVSFDEYEYLFGEESAFESEVNDKIVSGFHNQLQKFGLLDGSVTIDWADFHLRRRIITANFQVPESSVTTRMARLLYSISNSLQPSSIVCVGSAWGNALVWLAAGAPTAKCFGVDIDERSTIGAIKNFDSIGYKAEFIIADGRKSSRRLPKVDLLLLDTDDSINRKGILVLILEHLLPKLSENCVVLAHDAALSKFEADFKLYRKALVQFGFKKTALIPVDHCGLEVSLL